jgi:hypothetical protein
MVPSLLHVRVLRLAEEAGLKGAFLAQRKETASGSPGLHSPASNLQSMI